MPSTPAGEPHDGGGVEPEARRIHVRGTVQGVGFRPFVYRLARAHRLTGWVLNAADGVHIHVEGAVPALEAFVRQLSTSAPQAARISDVDVACDAVASHPAFEIRVSDAAAAPTTRIAADTAACDACVRELFDRGDRRYRYPYINCTACGPRYSIVRALPYDRTNTTMAAWEMCVECAIEYHAPENRRFHAQPTACPACGPAFRLEPGADSVGEPSAAQGEAGLAAPDAAVRGDRAIAAAAQALREGQIVAVKGLGGYHLACDADNAGAVAALRQRKFRKEQAFAVMVRDLAVADRTADLTPAARALLASAVRPIVLAPARRELPGVAPGNRDVGLMLPYAPLHHVLFADGAPDRLVMTSGNRSSEPIAYDDEDARRRLSGLADALLVGDRPIARRIDDSVVRDSVFGPLILRRSRGLAPGAAATLPPSQPILALGGDLKSAITLVVDGQAYVSQHIGDLSQHAALAAFDETIRDLLAIYGVAAPDLVVVHDAHPEYASTARARGIASSRTLAVQHHRAHIASVLAERGALDLPVVGVAFDGTGYGDDGTIWGGEFFVGSVRGGFERAAHLRPAHLAGGDAAARHPVQAAAGFLAALDTVPDLSAPPFAFPDRYRQAAAVARSGVRTFATTSAGRLFDTVAALLGFTRPITFEGQAAIWLEHLGRGAAAGALPAMACRVTGGELDWRPALAAIIDARLAGVEPAAIARAFHRALARAVGELAISLAERAGAAAVVLSGGVMQNDLLLTEIATALDAAALPVWVNRVVPPNDGGLSLGQAAIAQAAPPL